jgi:glucokinase
MAAPAAAVLALDIGGTKLAAAVIDVDGRLLGRSRAATPSTRDPEALFDSVLTVSRSAVVLANRQVTAIGVGCGGPMRYPNGVVSPLNIPAWRDFPLRQRLQAAFSLGGVVVDNDAKALALGEHWRGAGRGTRNLLGMVVSTGLGGGIILDGQLLHGERGNAGHVGHVIVWPDGPVCGCGARGCVEGVASGSGLARRVAAAQAEGRSTDLGPGATAVEIAAAARAGDPLARELYRTAGQAVGRGIASAAALLDLERVVIGGSIALHAWDLLGPPLEHELRQAARLDFTRDLRVTRAELGDLAGLYGAARLALVEARS